MRLKFRMVMLIFGFLLLLYTLLSFVATSLKVASQKPKAEDQDKELENLLSSLENDRNFIEETLALNSAQTQVSLTPKLVKAYEERLANLESSVKDLKAKIAEQEEQHDGKELVAMEVAGLTPEQQIKMMNDRIANLEQMLSANQIQKRNVLSAAEEKTAPAAAGLSGHVDSKAPPAVIAVEHQDQPVCGQDEIYSPYCKSCLSTIKKYSDKINYVHVPRGAGSGFTIPVRSYLDCQPVGKGCWGDPAVTVQGNIDCGGRLPGCYGLNPLKNKNSVVILRNPINRLRSAFVDRQYPSGNIEQKALAKQTQNIIEYSKLEGISNCQVKILLGRSCTDTKEVTSSDLEVARTRLTAVDFFGISEYYNTSVCLLFKTFGGAPADHDFTVVKKSTAYNPEKYPLADEELEVVKKSEEIDLQFYEFAKQVFFDRLTQQNQPLLETQKF